MPRRPGSLEKLVKLGVDAGRIQRLRGEITALEKTLPPIPEALAVEDGPVANLRVHLRGNHLTQSHEVPRRFPLILAGEQQGPLDAAQSGRLQLAQWLTRPGHPLTARVMVNRIWRGHFGEGIVSSMDNFGRLGERPTNQPLLDYLAVRFTTSASCGRRKPKRCPALCGSLFLRHGPVCESDDCEKRDLSNLTRHASAAKWRPGRTAVFRIALFNSPRHQISTARRLCPQAVFLPVRMSHYAQVGRQIRAIPLSFTPLVEPDREAKSISTETTFARDIGDRATLRVWLLDQVDHLAARWRQVEVQARTVELKVRGR